MTTAYMVVLFPEDVTCGGGRDTQLNMKHAEFKMLLRHPGERHGISETRKPVLNFSQHWSLGINTEGVISPRLSWALPGRGPKMEPWGMELVGGGMGWGCVRGGRTSLLKVLGENQGSMVS